MQAAFVDIGLDRAAFIHASEISAREGNAVEPINALVHEGQSLVVQVTKDPIGTKGARLTTQLSIPSRYLVYMPRTSHVGISLRIEDEAERERLKQRSEEHTSELPSLMRISYAVFFLNKQTTTLSLPRHPDSTYK